jgi:hypothetical protein
MNTKEMVNTIRDKNHLIILQTRRINLLENKLDELRKQYFKMKHAGILLQL